jgi:hypothetical protein
MPERPTARIGHDIEEWGRPFVPVIKIVTDIDAVVAKELLRRLGKQYAEDHPDAALSLPSPATLERAAAAILGWLVSER